MPSGSTNLGKPLGKISGTGIPTEGRTFVTPSFSSNRRAESWELSNDVVISGSAGPGNKLNWPDDSVCAARARAAERVNADRQQEYWVRIMIEKQNQGDDIKAT